MFIQVTNLTTKYEYEIIYYSTLNMNDEIIRLKTWIKKNTFHQIIAYNK